MPRAKQSWCLSNFGEEGRDKAEARFGGAGGGGGREGKGRGPVATEGKEDGGGGITGGREDGKLAK